ncbi:MAG: TonB-dependent receptor plug domain-containing protein [Tenacibaculum sp.]
MIKKVFCFSVLTAFLTYCLNAQVDNEKDIILDDVVISDSKFKLKRENSGKLIHKITRKTIEQNSTKGIADLINTVAGVEINGNSSSFGSILSVFVRGGVSKEVLVLIDGIQVYDPANFSGVFDLRFLDLSNIEYIEIIKGAASTLYGTGATTAVINIKLKEAEKDKPKVNLSVFGGSNNDQKIKSGTLIQSSANVSGQMKGFNYLASFSSFDTRGISSARPENAGLFKDDPFQRISTRVKLSYKINDKFSIGTAGNYTEFSNSYDKGAFADGFNNSLDKNYRISLSPKYNYQNGSVQINTAYSKYEADRTNTSFPSISKSENYIADAFVKHQFDKIYFVGGINLQQNEITENKALNSEGKLEKISYFEKPKTILIDPYLNAVYVSDFGLNLNGGFRLNNHNKYGNHLVYHFNPSYRIKKDKGYIKFLASYSTSFLAPSIQELYSINFGNVNLKPQGSTTVEAGLEYRLSTLLVSALYFNRKIKNTFGIDSSFKPINQGNTKIQGFEFSAKYPIFDYLHLNANYTFTENKNLAIRIPKHKANAELNCELKNTNLALNYMYVSDRKDKDFRNSSVVSLKEYSLLGFSANHQLNSHVKLFLAATNLLNEDYQEVLGYTTLGRNLKLGVSFNF